MNWTELVIQLGIAGFALYILWDLIKRHNKRIDERDKVFRDYASEHNHEMTKLVVTATDQIKELTRAIKLLYEKLNGKK